MNPDVIVIGGGIAGLATAYELSRRDVPTAILERGPRAGGVILSEQIDGFTIDAGPDSLLTQKPDGIKLCQEIGLADRLVPTKPPRLAFIQRGGILHPLPAASVLGIPTRFGPFIGTRLFSWAGKLRMGAEVFVPARRDDSDESIGHFIARRFGREAADYLAEPLLAGIHAGDVDRLSIKALFPRFADAERKHGSLIRAFRSHSSHRAPGQPSVDGAFRSLPGGLSEMVDALVKVLPPGAIRLNCHVTRVVHTPRGVRAELADGSAIEARAAVFATPAYVTSALVRDLDAALAQLCEQVPYASTGTVALAFRREQISHALNGSGFVVPRLEGTGILAGSWLSSKWPHRAPDDHVLLRTFVGGARDPQALDKPDAELVKISLDALQPLLGITGEPLFTRVYRFVRANAQHEVGHLARQAAIDQALGRHPGLFVTGSGFRGVGIPDCVADGRATAGRAADWLKGHLQA